MDGAMGDPARAPGIVVEGERRPLTVVCCALTAAGPGLEDVDVEEVDEAFGDEQQACAEIARRHGGCLAGALGEQVFLYFGYPVAQEDDARRAARAALEVATKPGASSTRLLSERGVVLERRVGIHTGIIVAREGDASVQRFGRTPEVAARLSELAAPGTIVVSGDVHRILRGGFTFEETTAELPEGGAAYRLERAITGASAELEGMPLFGRAQEIDLLLQRWGQARQGAGQVVLVTGEPGIGKSRLTLELARRLRGEAHTCLEGRGTPDRRSSTLHPIVEVLERLLDAEGDEASGGRLERLEALLARCGFPLAEAVPLLAALLSIPLAGRYTGPAGPPHRQKERTFQALLALLFERAEEQPILLLIEDLHWADPTTLEWLAALVAEVPSGRMMVLCTARPELSPPWPTSGMLQIQLGHLGRAHVEQIATQVAGGRALPGAVIDQIVRRADGIPLFVEELCRMLIASGALREEQGRYVLAAPLSTLAIPTTLQGLLRARLDRLGRAKGTAQIAAALGREFWQDVLGAVSPLGEVEVQEDLDELLWADLVHRRHRARGPTHVFKHALIRDAAYESLPKHARRRVHARIAATLEERFPQIAEACPEVLMLHHAAAEQHRQAIGYAERAAESALVRPISDGTPEAEEHIDQALGWLAAIEDERERVLTELRLNNLLFLAVMGRKGYGPDVATVVERFRSLNEKVGESPPTSPALLLAMFTYHHLRSHRREALALAERLMAMAERSQGTSQIVWAQELLGQCLAVDGKHGEARRCFERVLSLYVPPTKPGDTFMHGLDARAYAQATLSRVLYLMGEPDRALATAEAAVAWAHDIDHPNSLGVALLHLALVHQLARRREKVLEVVGSLTGLARRYKLWIEQYGGAQRCWAEGDVVGVDEHVEA
jgi:TOMM system kinase/cyclase fusion protein